MHQNLVTIDRATSGDYVLDKRNKKKNISSKTEEPASQRIA